MIKGIYEKPASNTIFNSEKTKCFPPKNKNKARIPAWFHPRQMDENCVMEHNSAKGNY